MKVEKTDNIIKKLKNAIKSILRKAVKVREKANFNKKLKSKTNQVKLV